MAIQLYEGISGRRNSEIGHSAPLFEKADINGKMIPLSSFRNRNYVLLDFWASWCVPCREITPRIKNIYEEYHSKGLVVIGISWDLTKEKWKDAVIKDSIGEWVNVAGFFDPANNDGLRTQYSIQSIPTEILIDKNGTIIGRYAGGDSIGELEKN